MPATGMGVMNITKLCFLLFIVSDIITKNLILFVARKQETVFSCFNSCTISSNPSKYKVFFRNNEIKCSHDEVKADRALQSHGNNVTPFSLKIGHLHLLC